MKFIRIGSHNRPIPQRATDGSAGYDLCFHSAFDGHEVAIDPGSRLLLPTGFGVELAPLTVGMVCSRSGLANKSGLFVLNAPGIIDSDYRGEIKVILANFGTERAIIKCGERIAQLVVVNCVMTPPFEGIAFDTERGSGGFGSTGS